MLHYYSNPELCLQFPGIFPSPYFKIVKSQIPYENFSISLNCWMRWILAFAVPEFLGMTQAPSFSRLMQCYRVTVFGNHLFLGLTQPALSSGPKKTAEMNLTYSHGVCHWRGSIWLQVHTCHPWRQLDAF